LVSQCYVLHIVFSFYRLNRLLGASFYSQMNLIINPITPAEIATFVRWRYEPPVDMYNMLPDEESGDAYDEIMAYFLEPELNCCAILHENEFVGFCTFGLDGRVIGGDYSQPALDIGMGMKPELTGQKHGDSFIAAIIQYANQTFNPSHLRVTIAATNQRAQRVWKKAGFVQQEQFICPRNGKSFFIFSA